MRVLKKQWYFIGLIVLNILIILSGLLFFYSGIVTGFKIPAFGSYVPGYTLGLLILYMGIVNFIKLHRLSAKIKGKKFSFSNFK